MRIKFIKNWNDSNLNPIVDDMEFIANSGVEANNIVFNELIEPLVDVEDTIYIPNSVNTGDYTITEVYETLLVISETIVNDYIEPPTSIRINGSTWYNLDYGIAFHHIDTSSYRIELPSNYIIPEEYIGQTITITGTNENDGDYTITGVSGATIFLAEEVTNESASNASINIFLEETVKTSDDFKLVKDESDYDSEKYVGKDFFMHEPREASLTFLKDDWLIDKFSKNNLEEEINVYLFLTEEGDIIEYDGNSPPEDWVVGFDTGNGIIDKIEVLIADISTYVIEIYEGYHKTFTALIDKSQTEINNDTITIIGFDFLKLIEIFGDSLIEVYPESDNGQIVFSENSIETFINKIKGLTNLEISTSGISDVFDINVLPVEFNILSASWIDFSGYDDILDINFSYVLQQVLYDCYAEAMWDSGIHIDIVSERFFAWNNYYSEKGVYTFIKVKANVDMYDAQGCTLGSREDYFIVLAPNDSTLTFNNLTDAFTRNIGRYKIIEDGVTTNIKSIEQAINDIKTAYNMIYSVYYEIESGYSLERYENPYNYLWQVFIAEQTTPYSPVAFPVFDGTHTYLDLLKAILFVGRAKVSCMANGYLLFSRKDSLNIENAIPISLNQIEDDWDITGIEADTKYIPKALSPVFPVIDNVQVYNNFYATIKSDYNHLIKNLYPREFTGKLIINRISETVNLDSCLIFEESDWKIVEGKFLDSFRYEFRALEVI